MSLFKRQPKSVIRPPDMVENPLEAVPEVMPDVKMAARADNGGIILEINMDERRGGFYRTVSKYLKFRNVVSIELDRGGGLFWELIDGRRNLVEISRQMRDQLMVDDKHVQAAVVEYVKQLMIRNLIFLKMPRKDGGQAVWKGLGEENGRNNYQS